MQPLKSVAYASVKPGPRLIILGAVHGDETCGTRAIERVIGEIDAGTLRLAAGQLTLVPVTNPLAYANHHRAGDRNLNRKLTPTDTPRDFERARRSMQGCWRSRSEATSAWRRSSMACVQRHHRCF